jgi:hypothetical protein
MILAGAPCWQRKNLQHKRRHSLLQKMRRYKALGVIRRSILLVRGWRVWHNTTPAMLGQKLCERFDGLVDRLFLNLTYEPAAKKIDWPRLIQELAA